MRRVLVGVVIGVMVMAAVAVLTQSLDSSRFESWTREDGPVENLQALLYALSGMFFFVGAIRERRNVWVWIFAIGMLFCAGEEISWGQRIFDFAVPSALDQVNIQHEANLHNVENIHGNVRTFGFMALGAMFVVLPLAESIFDGVRKMRHKTGFFGVPLHVAPVAAAAFGFMLIPRYIDADAFGFDEVGELFTALTMCTCALAYRATRTT